MVRFYLYQQGTPNWFTKDLKISNVKVKVTYKMVIFLPFYTILFMRKLIFTANTAIAGGVIQSLSTAFVMLTSHKYENCENSFILTLSWPEAHLCTKILLASKELRSFQGHSKVIERWFFLYELGIFISDQDKQYSGHIYAF